MTMDPRNPKPTNSRPVVNSMDPRARGAQEANQRQYDAVAKAATPFGATWADPGEINADTLNQAISAWMTGLNPVGFRTQERFGVVPMFQAGQQKYGADASRWLQSAAPDLHRQIVDQMRTNDRKSRNRSLMTIAAIVAPAVIGMMGAGASASGQGATAGTTASTTGTASTAGAEVAAGGYTAVPPPAPFYQSALSNPAAAPAMSVAPTTPFYANPAMMAAPAAGATAGAVEAPAATGAESTAAKGGGAGITMGDMAQAAAFFLGMGASGLMGEEGGGEAPDAPKTIPADQNPKVEKAATRATRKARSQFGRWDTILTGPMGRVESNVGSGRAGRKTLLGL